MPGPPALRRFLVCNTLLLPPPPRPRPFQLECRAGGGARARQRPEWPERPAGWGSSVRAAAPGPTWALARRQPSSCCPSSCSVHRLWGPCSVLGGHRLSPAPASPQEAGLLWCARYAPALREMASNTSVLFGSLLATPRPQRSLEGEVQARGSVHSAQIQPETPEEAERVRQWCSLSCFLHGGCYHPNTHPQCGLFLPPPGLGKDCVPLTPRLLCGRGDHMDILALCLHQGAE